jgi:hypothetical protein
MSDRSWFFASQGQQQGPFPEAQFRQFIAAGTVTAETLVWSEGMTGWQRAGDIPGLLAGISVSSAVAQPGGRLASTVDQGGGRLSIELGLWSFLGWTILFPIGLVLVIPAPWVATTYYRWMIARLRVPGRPDLAFTGQIRDIWYVFVAMGLLIDSAFVDIPYLQYLDMLIQALLSWMTVRWIAVNFSSLGRALPITFEGSALAFIGWYVLLCISAITIIGWAWVTVAMNRWICRNISGTRRTIEFTATGWEILWRTFVFALGCMLLLPLPWVIRWYTQWYASQFALVERTALAGA